MDFFLKENGAETEPTKDDTQSINGQQQETKEELNNPPHISFVRKRRRTKRKSLISPELRESLKRYNLAQFKVVPYCFLKSEKTAYFNLKTAYGYFGKE